MAYVTLKTRVQIEEELKRSWNCSVILRRNLLGRMRQNSGSMALEEAEVAGCVRHGGDLAVFEERCPEPAPF